MGQCLVGAGCVASDMRDMSCQIYTCMPEQCGSQWLHLYALHVRSI